MPDASRSSFAFSSKVMRKDTGWRGFLIEVSLMRHLLLSSLTWCGGFLFCALSKRASGAVHRLRQQASGALEPLPSGPVPRTIGSSLDRLWAPFYNTSNGTELKDGDSVTIIKDLKVKGSSVTLKMGTKVKSIRIVGGDHEVDCKVDGMNMMLKACYLKKV